MDINTAALRLKEIEIIEKQILHLQEEAVNSDLSLKGFEYSKDCNNKAQELIKLYFKPVEFRNQ